ncbi:MAG TPA: hypothetical protein IAC02_07795 [Candidatus Coprovivens excrementavium]|nr:hypothetical protein [Candidatus Coprovivens excrementavium]
MDTYVRFLYEFLDQLFGGVVEAVKDFFLGILQMFDVRAYASLIKNYSADFTGGEWFLVVIAIICTMLLLALFIFCIYILVRKYIRFRKTLVEQESLLEELADLHKQVRSLMKEKDELYAMKVSQLGLNPDEDATVTEGENNEEVDDGHALDTRFPKLVHIDEIFKDYKIVNYNNSFTLPELCENFRNFCASELKLYYHLDLIRLFIAALSSTKLVILQGISGTGKTSLAYAWGKFVKHDSCVASVQPSWRDRTELFGYFNEFTKKFTETDLLAEIYMAGYTDDIYTIILDEMNISRVEYYFAEMLSILEMPSQDEWIVELTPSAWSSDPKRLNGGKLKIAPNVWYIGTINNDDSTFMVTDKVYDRAMPIDINDKGTPFEPVPTQAMDINYSYLEKLYESAINDNQISDETLDKIEKMDDYVIQHFRIAFGNRIVAHMKKFVPVYVACGGTEIDGVDYFIAKKILRKFEQLNVSYIRDEIDGFIKFLDTTFGKGKMKECTEYLLRIKKLT